MAANKPIIPAVDETPSGMLAEELSFDYFKTLLTTALTILGGAVAAKGALLPDAPNEPRFLMALGLIAAGGLFGLDGQNRIIENLRKKRVGNGPYVRFLSQLAPAAVGLGTGVLIAYFLNNG